ncbi:hypothetical protein CC1G_14487 [Coprinopsis cinerea okayama7|uniref:Uncharacterized protein n=1 Tax=Coprinopsis cinerea (strain Okayama-7 / 130 / ATCC MYA-4618 / FGSC 9003) TaxID=240176 RepID=D6RME2_COPC7|nr:hypothetical protein CC1G_14487 [Coprinopsis cinerea okayama7\|eukprot:XP_002911489.1 hypothetical protein CC1G_14487 [Coprinopsis cinerea okayama7\
MAPIKLFSLFKGSSAHLPPGHATHDSSPTSEKGYIPPDEFGAQNGGGGSTPPPQNGTLSKKELKQREKAAKKAEKEKKRQERIARERELDRMEEMWERGYYQPPVTPPPLGDRSRSGEGADGFPAEGTYGGEGAYVPPGMGGGGVQIGFIPFKKGRERNLDLVEAIKILDKYKDELGSDALVWHAKIEE